MNDTELIKAFEVWMRECGPFYWESPNRTLADAFEKWRKAKDMARLTDFELERVVEKATFCDHSKPRSMCDQHCVFCGRDNCDGH